MAATFLLGASSLIKFEIAWGADLTADSSTWSWTDITSDVRRSDGVSITWGRSDEASTTQPATVSFRVNNTSGAYSLGGESSNWPYVRKGAPVRVRIDPDGAGYITVFQGEATGFTPDWNVPGNVAIVTVTAAGPLRRLGQGQNPLQSSMRRDITADPTCLAYWPCEEGERSSRFAPAVGPYSMTYDTAPDFAAESYFECSAPLPVFKGSMWIGSVPTSSTTEWQVRFLVKFPESQSSSGTNDSQIVTILASGTAAVWALYYQTGVPEGEFKIRAFDRNLGTIYTGTTFTSYVNQANMGAFVSITASQNGANIDLSYTQSAILDDSANTFGFTDTLAGYTVGQITAIWVNSGGNLDDVALGHIAVHNDAAEYWEGLDAARAWRSEQANSRIVRLTTETDQVISVVGTSTVTMGPQLPATLLELLRECETADGGVLYDGRGQGLAYSTRSTRENRWPDLELDATAAELAPTFDVVDDDQRIRNKAAVTRKAASTFTYEDTDGALGTATIGTYDTSATVSLYTDDAASDYASWLVHQGTVEGYRYPSVRVDLRRQPSLARTVFGIVPGHRIDVANLDSTFTRHPGSGPLALLVEGGSLAIGSDTCVMTFKCSPYSPWVVAQLSGTSDVVTFNGAGTKSEAADSTSTIATTLPTQFEPGDLLLIIASVRNSGTGTIQTPGNWTSLVSSGNVTVFGRIAPDASLAGPTLTATGGAANETWLVDTLAVHGTHRDIDQVLHASAVQLNASAANVDYPGLTITEDGCIAVVAGWKQDDWTSVATLAGMTEAFDVSSTLGSDAGLVADYVVQTSAANISSGSFVVTGGASAISRGLTMAFLPDPDPPTARLDTTGSTLTSSIAAGATSMSVTTTDAGTITYVAAGAVAVGNNASVAPALPTGWAAGDLLLIMASIRNSGTGTVTTPAGWTALVTTGNVTLLGQIAQSDSTAPTVAFSGGVANATTIAQCFGFRGTDNVISSVITASATQLNGSAQDIAYPALTVPQQGCAVVVMGWKQDDWTSVAQLSGMTEITDSPQTTGDDAGHVVDYVIQTSTSNISSGSFTVTGGASAISRAIVIAIKPYAGDRWTTDSADYPIDLDVGGVKITATACTDSVSPQTMTIDAAPVARTSGIPVKLWQPPALARR